MPLVSFAQSIVDMSANPYSKPNDDQFELILPSKMEYQKSVVNGNTIYTTKRNKVKANSNVATVTFTYDYVKS